MFFFTTEKIEDNFDKWGIQIKVKFRDSEKLQVLTGQRQSGGVCYHCFSFLALFRRPTLMLIVIFTFF